MRNNLSIRRAALLVASTVGLTLMASSANAQGYGYDRYDAAYSGPTEEVNVYTPSYGPRRSHTGAPIRDVEMTRAVQFHDLDLRTNRGARVLKDRIRYTARDLCRQLERRAPIATGDSPPCYNTAVEEAMYQADAAIYQARRYASYDR